MSAISLSITTPSTQRVPFCDKRFQKVRVAASCIADICLGVILKVAAFFVAVCSRKASNYLHSLSYHYSSRSKNAATFSNFGSKVIDFSVNTKLSPQEKGMEGLKKVYGNVAIAHWSRIGTPEVPLNQAKLGLESGGCCMGMSLDFIARYFKELQKNKTPLEAVKAIAPIYAEGAPPEAEIGQIFYQALDISLIQSRFDSLIEEYGAAPINSPRIAAIQSECLRLILAVGHVRTAAIAQKMGLSEGAPHRITLESEPACLQFINDLNPGVYGVSFHSSESGKGHLMALIKTAAEHFIFDPNYATFTFNREAIGKDLWSLGQFYKASSLMFRPITPN